MGTPLQVRSSCSKRKKFLLLFLALRLLFCFAPATCSVSYDRKAIVINGHRRILISGSIHYPRSTPEMWPYLIQKAKDGGLDVIQTYVFWNAHEPSPGVYNFEGRLDLIKFIKLVKDAGLYLHLRIGPYVCAEWNFGGFPVWLKYIPGISFRTDNEPFKTAMEGFTKKIVQMMKDERLFESQGGPIILSQIENEYGPEEWAIGEAGVRYTNWMASMAVNLETGVPWVMCKQDDAPDPIINTCNGFYCDWFSPNADYKPKIWTELWTSWFTSFGGAIPSRPVEDIAFSVAKFIQKGGSFINYYMYHGGTNFGRTSGGPFIATSYDYDAPIDEYGILRQPKWGHLKDLHKAIKMCEATLVSGDLTVSSLGTDQEAHVFESDSGHCAAFLANYHESSYFNINFRDGHYHLPPWSISILPDCINVVFNTARIGAQTSLMTMAPTNPYYNFSWETFSEDIASYVDGPVLAEGLLEQINLTRDSSDYLWYMTTVEIDSDEDFLKNGKYPNLTVMSAGHALHVFVNGELSGTAYGSVDDPKLTYTSQVKLLPGINKISLLSIAVGLQNVGVRFERWNTGILGPVMLDGLKEGIRDLSWQKWSYKVGLEGETLQLHSLTGSSSVEWVSLIAKKQPLTWYKATFDAPKTNDSLALDMTTMGKGQIWINGESIGRYWPAYNASGSCRECSYTGTFNETKCLTNCGSSSQRWYHVPRSFLNPTGNLLVVFEEWGGDVTGISLVKRTIGSVCAFISESQPTLRQSQFVYGRHRHRKPRLRLSCAEGQKITFIKFASFGTPEGVCGSFKEGHCHSNNSYAIFEKNCIHQQFCSITVSLDAFGGDPCPEVMKVVAVEAVCEQQDSKYPFI